jgi:NADPH-dependent ferric siderophore reductase
MPKPAPISDAERAELRRLYLAARGGRWEAHVLPGDQIHLVAVQPSGGYWLLAMPNKAPDAQLMAAARNALPRLFAEIDELCAQRRGVPVLGEVH